jgi:copper oxidase (laccase) domain-containing protein
MSSPTNNLISYHRILPIGEFLTYQQKPTELELIHTHQVHSNLLTDYKLKDISNEQVDGMVATYEDIKGKALAIKTADCMPIVLLGEQKVAFLHAGWKGLADGILASKLIKDIKPFFGFIGPSIHLDSFEVSEDFQDNFPNSTNFLQQGDQFYFDLQKEAMNQMYQYFDGIKVVDSLECTLSIKKYHSYRQNKTPDRNWNLFTLSV